MARLASKRLATRSIFFFVFAVFAVFFFFFFFIVVVYFRKENSCNQIDLNQQATTISRYLLLSNQFQFDVCKTWFQFTHSSLLPFNLCVLSMILKQRLIEEFRLRLHTIWLLLWIHSFERIHCGMENVKLLQANDLWMKIICSIFFLGKISKLLAIPLINTNIKIFLQF